MIKNNHNLCSKRIAALQLYALRHTEFLGKKFLARFFSQNDCFYWRRLLVPPFFINSPRQPIETDINKVFLTVSGVWSLGPAAIDL